MKRTEPEPPTVSAEARYASIHRAVEAGACGDETWTNLFKVCVELDKGAEAVEAYRRMQAPRLRSQAFEVLAGRGLLPRDEEAPKVTPALVSDAGVRLTLAEQLGEAFAYLLEPPMPVLALGGTAAFAAMLGAGSLLGAASGTLVAALVCLPVHVALFGAVGAVARGVLLDSCRGLDDPPTVVPCRALLDDARRAALELPLLGAVLVGPGLALHAALEAAAMLALLLSLAGWALLPLAFAMRQLAPSWREVTPARLAKLLARSRAHPLAAVAATLSLFAPVAVATHLALGLPAALMISLVGVLAATPLLLSARMIGRMLHGSSAPFVAARAHRTPR